MNDPFRPALTRFVESLERIVPGIRYISLWIFFAMLLVLFPFVKGDIGAFIFTVLFSLILISSVLTASAQPTERLIGLVLLAISLITRWSYFLTGGPVLNELSFLFGTLTLALVSILLFLALFKTKAVTSTTIWQAISVYLLLGLAWACFYAFMEALAPGSFRDSIYPDVTMTFPTIVYFSFVTLATLGYGDILPTTQEARGLIIIEVLMGVLYMAILISRLVGTWKPGEEKEN
jgi:hypothetical protein